MLSCGLLTLCASYKSKRFGKMFRSIIRAKRIRELRTLSVTSNQLQFATRRNILEGGILHRRRRENFKAYIELTDWAL
jgi:hypothetical protein